MRKIIASMAALVGLILVSFSYFLSLNKYQDLGLENALDCESPERIINLLYLGLLFTVLSLVMALNLNKALSTKFKSVFWAVGLFALALGFSRLFVAQQENSKVSADCEIKFLN